MASILNFYKSKEPKPLVQNGQTATLEEDWQLYLDSEVSELQARIIVNSLEKNNDYGWPRLGIDPHPDSSVMLPTGYRISRNEGLTTRHDITLNYTDEVNQISRSKKATQADPSYDYQDVDIIEEVDFDPINNKIIAASNGERPFPKFTKKGNGKRIIVTRNERSYDPSLAEQYEDKLNQGSLRINRALYPARTLLLESWVGKNAVDVDGSRYYIVTYKFLYKKGGHARSWVDAGRGPDKNRKIPKTGQAYKLDGEGAYMSNARQLDPTQYVLNENYVNDEISMGRFNL